MHWPQEMLVGVAARSTRLRWDDVNHRWLVRVRVDPKLPDKHYKFVKYCSEVMAGHEVGFRIYMDDDLTRYLTVSHIPHDFYRMYEVGATAYDAQDKKHYCGYIRTCIITKSSVTHVVRGPDPECYCHNRFWTEIKNYLKKFLLKTT